MRYIEAIKIVQLLAKGKRQLVDQEYELLLNKEYSIDNNNINLPLLEYLRILLKALQHEYNLDAESETTYDLYLKLIQIVDADYSDDVALNTNLQFSNISDGVVTVIRESAWGSIIGDITQQLDLTNTIATAINNIPAPESPDWGDLGGTVTDQQDLVDYINAQIDGIDIPTPTSSRFGIEDNIGVQTRDIDMQGSNLEIYNAGEWYLSADADGNSVWSISSASTALNGPSMQVGVAINSDSFNIVDKSPTRDLHHFVNFNSGTDFYLETPTPANGTYFQPISVNDQVADSTGNITLTIPSSSTPSLQAVTDIGNVTTNQVKIGTTVVNTNYKLLVGAGLSVTSGALNMDEYESYFHMSGGRCALIANGSGIQYRLFNNDLTDFPDTSKSFIWRNKGFEHMKLYCDALTLNGLGQPATWEFKTRIKYKLYLPDIPATTGAYKVLTKNDSTGEVETALIAASTASNGLTMSSNDISLGGVLTSSPLISGGNFGVTISRSNNQAVLTLSSTGNGAGVSATTTNNYAVLGTATGGQGVRGISTTGTGVYGQTDSGTGVNGYSTGTGSAVTALNFGTGSAITASSVSSFGLFSTVNNDGASPNSIPLLGSVSSNVTTGILKSLQLQRTVRNSLAAANGYGQSIHFATGTSGLADTSTELISKWTNATYASRLSEFSITGNTAGSVATIMKFTGNGRVNISQGALDLADNAAALAAGLVVGDIYRTGDLLKIVH